MKGRRPCGEGGDHCEGEVIIYEGEVTMWGRR